MKRSWRNMWGSRVFLKILPRVLSCRLHRQTSHLEIKLSEQGNQHERISSSQQKFQEWDPALTQIRAWDFTATISRQVTTSDDQKWTSKIRNISEIFSFSGKYFSAAPFFSPFLEQGEKLSTLRFLVSPWEVLKGPSVAPSRSLRGSGVTSPLNKKVEHVHWADPAWGILWPG